MNRKDRRAEEKKLLKNGISADYEPVYQAALKHHQSGNVDEAATLYRKVLMANPRHADSWHLLGMITFLTGNAELGEEQLTQAIKLAPDEPIFRTTMGSILKGRGKLQEAAESHRHALKLVPDYAEAHYNLGLVLKEMGDAEAAAESFRRALLLKPSLAAAEAALSKE